MSERKHLSADQKVIILRELLENNVPVSQLAEKYNIHPNDIYNWKKKLFESAIKGSDAIQILTTPHLSYSKSTFKSLPGFMGIDVFVSRISCLGDSSIQTIGKSLLYGRL